MFPMGKQFPSVGGASDRKQRRASLRPSGAIMVLLHAIGVVQQSDPSRAIRVILNRIKPWQQLRPSFA